MLYSRVFFSAARDLSFKVRHRSVWGSASDSTGSATLLFDAQSLSSGDRDSRWESLPRDASAKWGLDLPNGHLGVNFRGYDGGMAPILPR